MIEATTKNGLDVWVAFNPDCEYNTGGFYCEIWENPDMDCLLDDFCIHIDDCDCTDLDAVEQYAKDYVSGLVID